MKELRKLIIDSAKDLECVSQLEETLRWGEPSYISETGSTIRIDWKEKTPEKYAIYFKCTSQLVPTFKKVFGKTFKFEGNRAIVFQMNDRVPKTKLKKAIKAALQYHKVKNIPNLGL